MHRITSVSAVPALVLGGVLGPSPALSQAPPPAVDWVVALFPGATVQEATTREGEVVRVIAPVGRDGLWGYVPVEEVQAAGVAEGHVIAFPIRLGSVGREGWASLLRHRPTYELSPDADLRMIADLEAEAPEGSFLALLQVALTDRRGTFVSKPEGFPLEQEVGPGTDHAFRVRGLAPVSGSDRAVVLEYAEPEPAMFSGLVRALAVEGTAFRVGSPEVHGTLYAMGCEITRRFESFRLDGGSVVGARTEDCDREDATCGSYCEPEPTSVVTLLAAGS